jgi:hypothetical protein
MSILVPTPDGISMSQKERDVLMILCCFAEILAPVSKKWVQ